MTGLSDSNPAKRRVSVTFSGEWLADPREFVGDGRDDVRALKASDAELAEEMRRYGSKDSVLREWNLLDYVEVYIGRERVW
jgi:hypothetical protein